MKKGQIHDVFVCLFASIFILVGCQSASDKAPPKLKKERFQKYVEAFNRDDSLEAVVNAIPNAKSWEWMKENIPFFECPDPVIEKIYYYRWWTFRKHIKQTPKGFVFTEFITQVGHSGEYNTISCALGHHIMEGRWLKDTRYLDEYILFWFRGNNNEPQPHFHNFSGWVEDALYKKYMVDNDSAFVLNLFPDLLKDYELWEKEKQLNNGLFWQFDVRDGMEESISGSRTAKNMRPTINSYMAGNARAVSALAHMTGKTDVAEIYEKKANQLSQLLIDSLWDAEASFFKVRLESGALSDAREAIGFVPWYFKIPGEDQNRAWQQAEDTLGFKAPKGLTTAERRHPFFRSHGTGSCEWDGAVWPFATSQILVGMANFIRDYDQSVLSAKDYFDVIFTYASSHAKNGKPYIGEYHNERTGEWLKGDNPRSIFYNHSTFCDLVISGIAGLVPRNDNIVEVFPLIPEENWLWFSLENVTYHGHLISIFWDKTGNKYGVGKGLSVFNDGKLIAHRPDIKKVTGEL